MIDNEFQCEVIDDEMHCMDGNTTIAVASGDRYIDRMEDDTCEAIAEIFIEFEQNLQKVDIEDIDSDRERRQLSALQLAREGMRSTLEHGCPEFHS